MRRRGTKAQYTYELLVWQTNELLCSLVSLVLAGLVLDFYITTVIMPSVHTVTLDQSRGAHKLSTTLMPTLSV